MSWDVLWLSQRLPWGLPLVIARLHWRSISIGNSHRSHDLCLNPRLPRKSSLRCQYEILSVMIDHLRMHRPMSEPIVALRGLIPTSAEVVCYSMQILLGFHLLSSKDLGLKWWLPRGFRLQSTSVPSRWYPFAISFVTYAWIDLCLEASISPFGTNSSISLCSLVDRVVI